MKQVKSFLVKLSVLILLSVVTTAVKSQSKSQSSCKDIYNRALSYYNKGRFENMEDYLSGCVKDFTDNIANYSGAGSNVDLVFKVYKLIINSYKNIDKDYLAVKKQEELIDYLHGLDFKYSNTEVQERLDNTTLNFIK